MTGTPLLFPRPLTEGDRIAIVSPSSVIDPLLVESTLPILKAQGWIPYVAPHALDRHGNFAGRDEDRLEDLRAALLDPQTRAVLCSRGGFGAVHLIELLNRLPLRDDPKWLIGFSDISALHALMSTNGIVSVHSPMCRHLVREGAEDSDSLRLFSLLRGERGPVEFGADFRNRPGFASGPLVGGNLAVTAGLLSTPFDIFKPGTILFIEDIAEPIYKVDRILHTLRLNGVLSRLGGLIVGQFTQYKPGQDGRVMEDMIADMVRDYPYPVAFNVPVGHVDHNVPLLYSAPVTLTVTSDGATLRYNEP